MNRTLNLLRHSYAESPNGKPDFERTLTHEGLANVRALGRHLIKQKFNPDIIVASSSQRTTDTAINLVEELEMNEQIITYEDKIYEASVRELLEVVNNLDDDKKEVALIGHNPSITFFGEYLSGASIGNMQPCSIVTIRFECDKWSEISQGSGIFESYYHPSH